MKTREELLKEFEEEPTAKKFSKSDKVIHFTPEELQQILSAPTKAQMKCKLCHPHIDLSVVTTGLVNKFDRERNEDIRLKYCPHCGRKLGDE